MIPPDAEDDGHPTTDHTGRRVYGAEWDDDPSPEPGHAYRELCGGPLDGLLLDVEGWTDEQLCGGAYLIVPRDPEGRRADYEPRPDDPERWDYRGLLAC
ncbi:hypothetical protein [Kitasatospora sp. NPDC088548]|uniref:hypothetical protein n=1 Tax=Kitasatospora sp. NPDC088548 TaxID=3364075 RepID=UPI00380F63BB